MRTKICDNDDHAEVLSEVIVAARQLLDAKKRFEELAGTNDVPERVTGSLKGMISDLIMCRLMRDQLINRIERVQAVIRDHGANNRVSIRRIQMALNVTEADNDEFLVKMAEQMEKMGVA